MHREKESKFSIRIRIKLSLVTFQNISNMTCFTFPRKLVLFCTNMLFIYIIRLYIRTSELSVKPFYVLNILNVSSFSSLDANLFCFINFLLFLFSTVVLFFSDLLSLFLIYFLFSRFTFFLSDCSSFFPMSPSVSVVY